MSSSAARREATPLADKYFLKPLYHIVLPPILLTVAKSTDGITSGSVMTILPRPESVLVHQLVDFIDDLRDHLNDPVPPLSWTAARCSKA
jgi:predicted short-subunit dehydrogenase-like oxidoreductase (DUF2520 family)